jgi:hypothetical protein
MLWNKDGTKIWYQLVREQSDGTTIKISKGTLSSNLPTTTTALALVVIGNTRSGSSIINLAASQLQAEMG